MIINLNKKTRGNARTLITISCLKSHSGQVDWISICLNRRNQSRGHLWTRASPRAVSRRPGLPLVSGRWFMVQLIPQLLHRGTKALTLLWVKPANLLKTNRMCSQLILQWDMARLKLQIIPMEAIRVPWGHLLTSAVWERALLIKHRQRTSSVWHTEATKVSTCSAWPAPPFYRTRNSLRPTWSRPSTSTQESGWVHQAHTYFKPASTTKTYRIA